MVAETLGNKGGEGSESSSSSTQGGTPEPPCTDSEPAKLNSAPEGKGQYHNPYPMVRLIGKINETKVCIDDVECLALVDSGAQMSTINLWLAKKLDLPIKHCNDFLELEATGRGDIPYYGYVEVNLKIPEIPELDEDILMFVIENSRYGQ